MDRKTRKNLKTDKFALEVTNIFDWAALHKKEVIRYGCIVLVVAAIAAGTYFYIRYRAGVRQEALAAALKIDGANVGQNAQPGMLIFPTQEDKDKAWDKAFTDVAAKYHGTEEGAIAEIYLAARDVDKGDLANAAKRYQDVMDSAPVAYASMARMSFAQVLAGEGKTADAEKLLREAIAKPSVTVSKDEATIQLALITCKSQPDEARKMLEPLRTDRTAVSRAAVQALSDCAAK